jgi:hypothetical protein
VLDEARRWNGVARIHTFGLGKPQEDSERKDIVVAGIQAARSVPAKTKLTVTGTVHALGFKDVVVAVELWAQGSRDKEPFLLGDKEKVQLKEEKNNSIVLVRDAPEAADEYKLTLKVEKLDGESDVTNNEASAYVLVTKEGISVLWVEGRKRPYEPIYAQRALAKDKRFRVYHAEADPRALAADRDFYGFDKRQYDVIVIGDLSAQQFHGGNPALLERVRDLVRDRKTGLLMLGGIDTFGKGGWNNTPLAELLPVALDSDKQIDASFRVRPAKDALNSYPFFKLDDDPKKNDELWAKRFKELDGMAALGKLRDPDKSPALAFGPGDEPIMVAGVPGGRVIVFGGDTTWKAWLRPKTIDAYNLFWKQLILWLADQDDRAGNVWIEMQARRVSAGSAERLEYTFGLKGKNGNEIPDAQFTVKAIGPSGQVINAPKSTPQKDHQRGSLPAPATAGEYRLEITGKGKDKDGGDVSDTKAAHFLVVSDNVELQRKAADHELLKDIAHQSGGQFYSASERDLLKLLSELKGRVRQESHAKTVRYPDWDRHPASDAFPDQVTGLWGSSSLFWFLGFAALLCTEWGLRRKWGMV